MLGAGEPAAASGHVIEGLAERRRLQVRRRGSRRRAAVRILPVRHDHGGAALLKDKPKPTDADIDASITNICRCGTFQQLRGSPCRNRGVGSE
jgi:hypothetical protein